ncbi:MAG: response regulator, partial [Gammaproteobacteria bacterium]|nr:response regulator [Gammaproteobacteria bacterium]
RGIQIVLLQDGVEIELENLQQLNHTVRADRVRLKQALLNLMSNAVKYNQENGKIIIGCKMVKDQNGNNKTRISITDTGNGLTGKQQKQLFKAFERLNAEKAEIEGTGIGLLITKNIIELMGGNIGVDSQPGKGSTFWIELPNDDLQIEHEDKRIKKEEIKMQTISSSDAKQEHTVLYIEDNPANLRLVNQLLGRQPNIHMWSAHEALLGLELAAEHQPDLILLDINLPGLSGYEVLKHLRQSTTTSHIPVIAISANAMPKDIEKGKQAGFDDYITKPIDINLLLNTVTKRLENKD